MMAERYKEPNAKIIAKIKNNLKNETLHDNFYEFGKSMPINEI
jgi:hypothetical protein